MFPVKFKGNQTKKNRIQQKEKISKPIFRSQLHTEMYFTLY